ncbi:hypothetical protein REPUB_Repub14bG0040200 [Reevesia pubescens]
MATSSITSTSFMLVSPSSRNSMNKSKIGFQRLDRSSNSNGKTVKFTQDSSVKIKMQAQPVLNDEIRVTSMIKSLADDEMTSPPRTMEHLTLAGRLIKGGLAFQQNFIIRSFEIDPEYKVSSRAIMNYLQEASLNYGKKVGLSTDTLFCITPEMRKRDLVWVFRCMRIEVDRYPSWGDVVQVYHWIYTSGSTGMGCNWIINDIKTGETLVRASCLVVMMNKNTRKTCKLPEEVKQEMKPYLMIDAEPIVRAERNSSPQVEAMDHIRTGLKPGWNDLDVNYHVNNAKYLDWILESTPGSIVYSHELCKINFEYRKECFKDDVIQSLSRVVTNETDHLSIDNRGIELEHLLRLETGPHVLRARTAWRPKSISQ